MQGCNVTYLAAFKKSQSESFSYFYKCFAWELAFCGNSVDFKMNTWFI